MTKHDNIDNSKLFGFFSVFLLFALSSFSHLYAIKDRIMKTAVPWVPTGGGASSRYINIHAMVHITSHLTVHVVVNFTLDCYGTPDVHLTVDVLCCVAYHVMCQASRCPRPCSG